MASWIRRGSCSRSMGVISTVLRVRRTRGKVKWRGLREISLMLSIRGTAVRLPFPRMAAAWLRGEMVAGRGGGYARSRQLQRSDAAADERASTDAGAGAET